MIWQIIFNGSFPNFPPDFDIGDSDFYSISLESFEEALPTLNNWDCTKDKALINVISELRSAYLKYQVEKLESIDNRCAYEYSSLISEGKVMPDQVEKLESIDNRCAYEYSSLISEGKVMPDQVEVFVDCDAVHFLIKLDVDLTIILPSPDPEEFVLLAVRFGAHGSVRSANLVVSPNVQRLLSTNLDLPHNITGEESLFDYVDEVARSVENQILTVLLQRKEKRKRYVFELLRHLGQSVVSYDALEYHSATFLLEKHGFVCLMETCLPPLFPRMPPSYRLMSVYSSSANHLPLSQNLVLPYSDKWEVPAMVDNALNLIHDKKIPEFQRCTVPSFKLPK